MPRPESDAYIGQMEPGKRRKVAFGQGLEQGTGNPEIEAVDDSTPEDIEDKTLATKMGEQTAQKLEDDESPYESEAS